MNISRRNLSTGIILALVAGMGLGVAIGWLWLKNYSPGVGNTELRADSQKPDPEVLYWAAPMDPNYRRDKPGKSPMGMDLVPVYAKPAADDSEAVIISSAVQHNMGLRTQAAEIRPLWRRMEATGYVGLDENRLSHVHVRTAGWIERLFVNTEGERVTKGQPLFEIYSPEILNAQMEYLQANRRGEAQLLRAAREKLLALGMQSSEIGALKEQGKSRQSITVVAPANGVVMALNVREGMFIKPEHEVMSLADLSSVWMQAEIFESQADWVEQAQAAEARFDYMPGEVFAGQVDYVYPILDPKSRTLRVRLRFENPDERLKPNMYASVTLFGRTHQDALTIPRDALIRAADNDRVVLALGDGRFRVQEVMTGIESGDRIEIIAGIEAGDEVVTSAQFLIDSEASLSGGMRRLEYVENSDGNKKPRTVFGSGVVDSLDRSARRMTISHGPIDTLGWPAMTMEFSVLTGIDLLRIQPGQNVHFSIRPDSSGVYVVEMVHLVDVADSEKEPDDD